MVWYKIKSEMFIITLLTITFVISHKLCLGNLKFIIVPLSLVHVSLVRHLHINCWQQFMTLSNKLASIF